VGFVAYVCNTEQDVDRIHRTDATELEVVENIRCYYLILGTIVQVIKEDPAEAGCSESVTFGGIGERHLDLSKNLQLA
jgi:hypothetical protein